MSDNHSKTAVFGGTFNPIHNGHISIGISAMEECGLSQVVFLPNGNPPHKKTSDMLPADIRYEMVRIAVSGYDFFSVSDYEIKKLKPSYTVESIPYLKASYGENISFIIGADSLFSLHTWKRYEELIKQCSFIVADRNVGGNQKLEAECERLARLGADIKVLSMKCVDITSTDIRNMIKSGHEFSDYVPCEVYDYINKFNLYQSCSEGKNDY